MQRISLNTYVKVVLLCQPFGGKRLLDDLEGIFVGLMAGFVLEIVFELYNCGIAEEAHEVGVKDPQVVIGKHEIDSFEDRDAEIYVF